MMPTVVSSRWPNAPKKLDRWRGVLTPWRSAWKARRDRIREVDATVRSASLRAADVESLGVKIEAAGQELETREKALQSAMADLGRATALHKDLSKGIRDLEEQERRVSHAAAAAGEQASLMAELADQVEGRVGNLRFAEKRITQFEEKLAGFSAAEQSLEQTLQNLATRQEGVDAVRGELDQLFTAVEGTVSDVRSITDARQEIQRSRAVLDDVLERAARVDELALAVDKKKMEIGDAEERMARLDTLLNDIQGSLETVHSQKAVVDAVARESGAAVVPSEGGRGSDHCAPRRARRGGARAGGGARGARGEAGQLI